MFCAPSLSNFCQKIISFDFFEMGLTSLPPIWMMSLNILFFFRVPLRTIRCNFKNLYRENLYCPLKCAPEGSSPHEDTQQHLISCNTIIQNLSDCQTIIAVNTIKYEDIYGDIYQQKAIVSLVKECLRIRNKIIEESKQSTSGRCMSLDPSTSLCCTNTRGVCIGT